VETVESSLAVTIIMQMTELIVMRLNVEGAEVIKIAESIPSHRVSCNEQKYHFLVCLVGEGNSFA